MIFALLFGVNGYGQGLNARFLNYIEQYKDVAVEQCRTHGVPASITLAQGLLESNAGASYLATRGNNHFGIKCHKWAGEAVEYEDSLQHDCYRKYGSAEDSFLDHSRFLCGKRYQPLHALDTADYRGWAAGLRTCGYAEDPAYPQKLIAIIERYSLSQYDSIAMLPPVTKPDKAFKKGKNETKRSADGEKKRDEVPAPPRKSKKTEPATVPPPPSKKDTERLRTDERQGREVDKEKVKPTKRRTSVELPEKIEDNAKAVNNAVKSPAADKPAEEPKPKPSRRQHNQRNTAAGKPLTGHSDNDD